MTFKRFGLLAAAGVFSFAQFLHAQALSSINGTVTDTSGAVVAGAKVTIKNNATGVTKTSQTSSAGTYTMTDVTPGTYTVTVDDSGFSTSVHEGVGVDVGRASTVDATLQPGSTQQTVTVAESAIALDTEAPSLNTTIENKVVQELPTLIGGGRGRQIDTFIFLAPGVTGGTFSHRLNGGVDFQNEVVFNGIPMAQSETQGYQTIWNPPFDLVNQYNVLRASFGAQYGLAQGVVTYQTASGTNQIHGNAFEIIRNNFFDARGAVNPTVAVDRENNYGFSVGGPVIIPKLYNGKNRTFFYLAMEWYRQNQGANGNFSLPTAAEKAGDFSGLGVNIYDPVAGLTGSCNQGGATPGQQFPGNKIPAACFSAQAKSLLGYMPDPTLSGYVNNQTSLLGVSPVRQNPWGFTIDHSLTDKQTLHWAMWRDSQYSYTCCTGLAPSNPLEAYTYYPDLGTVFLPTYSYNISPNLIMTAGASWLGELNFQEPRREGDQPVLAAAPGAGIVSGIIFNGNLSPSSFGTSNTNSINRKLGIVVDNNFLYIHGKNTFNIGWEFRRTYQDDNECQQCAGNFQFSNNETADPNYLANNDLSSTGNSFASFLLGTVDQANRTGSQELRLHNSDVSSYIQDDIKLSSKFTFNIGVRWDVMVPFEEANNNIVYFDSTKVNPDASDRLGAATKFGYCITCAGVDRAAIHWDHFAPRLGASYQLNSKTVLQLGGAINYLNGGAYEYGISKVAVNYGNLLLGSYTAPSLGSTTPGFGSWDTGTLPAPGQKTFTPGIGNGTTIDGFDPKNDGLAPYDAVWIAGIQRELPGNMFLTLNYTGNRGNHLPSQLNPINAITPGILAQYGSMLGESFTTVQKLTGIQAPYANFLKDFPTAGLLQALRPYPQYSSVFNNFDMSGSAFYNAFQAQLEKRYSSGLGFIFSYNYSRMLSSTNSGFTSFVGHSLNPNNQKAEWSVDNNDQPQLIKFAGTYELPFGKGRTWLNKGGITNVVLGGWQISPELDYESGSPQQIDVPGDPLGAGASNRANIVSGVSEMFNYNNVYKGLSVFNAAAFSNPGNWVIGDSSRYLSGVRSPFYANENIALAKYFPIGERFKFKLEVEYYNILNRVQFCTPDTTLTDTNFGKVISCQNNTPRQGQGHLTFYF